MTLTQLNKRVPKGYKIQWLEVSEGASVELLKDDVRVVKIGAMTQESALGSMKDWLIINKLYN